MTERVYETYIYTFPFWFWTSIEIKNEVSELKWNNNLLRIYSPFVMGKLYDLNLHQHRSGEVPILEGVKTKKEFKNIKAPLSFPHLNGKDITMLMDEEINSIDKLIDPFPANSIRIDYLNVEKSFSEDNFVQNLAEWIRCKTGLFWVGKVMPSIYRYNKLKYKSDLKGEQLSNGEVEATFFTLSGYEKSVNKEIWNSSLIEAIQDNAPPLYQSIFHDARYMHFIKDFRRAVLNSAIAIEEALKYYARKFFISTHTDKKFKFTRHFDNSKLKHNLDKHSKDFFGVSLKEENRPLYDLICQLWDTRHSTAHSGNAVIVENGDIRRVTEKDSIRFINAVKDLTKWLEEIPKK